MKKITLVEAYDILANCSAVVIDDDILIYPELADNIINDEAQEFMNLAWDIEGLTYEAHYEEGDNAEVEVVGCSMFLKNTDGDIDQITILEPKNLE